MSLIDYKFSNAKHRIFETALNELALVFLDMAKDKGVAMVQVEDPEKNEPFNTKALMVRFFRACDDENDLVEIRGNGHALYRGMEFQVWDDLFRYLKGKDRAIDMINEHLKVHEKISRRDAARISLSRTCDIEFGRDGRLLVWAEWQDMIVSRHREPETVNKRVDVVSDPKVVAMILDAETVDPKFQVGREYNGEKIIFSTPYYLITTDSEGRARVRTGHTAV